MRKSPASSKPAQHEQKNYQLWEGLTWDTGKVSFLCDYRADKGQAHLASSACAPQWITAKGNFTFNTTKGGKELHLIMCAASVSAEGFSCCCNVSRNNDVHRLLRQGFHCTTKASYEAKKIPGCTNLTWFCWIMLNLVPVTPQLSMGGRGTKPGIWIQLSHRVH